MINDKTILTCEFCCNFIICGIKPAANVLKCSAWLSIKEAKKYFKNVKNLTNGVFSKEMKK